MALIDDVHSTHITPWIWSSRLTEQQVKDWACRHHGAHALRHMLSRPCHHDEYVRQYLGGPQVMNVAVLQARMIFENSQVLQHFYLEHAQYINVVHCWHAKIWAVDLPHELTWHGDLDVIASCALPADAYNIKVLGRLALLDACGRELPDRTKKHGHVMSLA